MEGTLTIEWGDIVGKIREVSISTLQGEIRALAEQILREILQGLYPAGNATQYYVTTGEIADAVEVTGGGEQITISMNPSRLSLAPLGNGMLGAHMGVEGEDFRQSLLEGLNEGGISGSSVNPKGHPASNYMETAYNQYEAQFLQILARALSGAGFDVSIG